MIPFDQLPPAIQENVLRVTVAAEERAAALGLPFEMSLDDVVAAIEDFGGSLSDATFILPAGLVGVWKDHPVKVYNAPLAKQAPKRRTLSEETKRRMKEAALRRWASPGAKEAQSARLRRSK